MFEPKKRSLKELLDCPNEGDSQSQFVVPRFQRKYEWEKEDQVATLIDDVFSNLDRQYFVGPMIFYPKSEGKVEIIDGQQRLVTFVIFFRALVDYIQTRRDENALSTVRADEVDELKYDIRNLIIKGRRRRVPVLRLSKTIDREFREEILTNENPLKIENFKRRQRVKYPAVKRLKGAYLKIFESLRKKYDSLNEAELLNSLQDLVDALENKQSFVSLTVDSYNDAYTIFATINARGKPLNLSDLVKIVCFEKLDISETDETYLDELEDCWDEAESQVNDFGAFIWHLWVSNYESCSKKKVFTKIEEHFKTITKNEAERFIYDTIFDEADWYHAYENPDEISELDDDIALEKKRYLEMLKAMGATRCYPLLLSIDYSAKPETNTLTREQANELLKKIVCLTFWHSGICEQDARHLEAIYHGLALRTRKIGTGPSETDVNYVLNELSKQFPSEDLCKDNFLSKKFDNGNFVKMMLRNMEEQKYPPAEKGLKGSKAVWLEHVLPKSPGEDSEWKKIFEGEERVEYVGRLGNHALLYGPTNRRIGNQDFSEKKGRYGDSDCGLTREIADEYDKWDKETIEERTRKLFELAKQVWPIC